uniref:Uncharacterized protein n=1 Tax=Anguilla anguilla TaxID=7936 RepID=A0A0E9SVP3_ANGAN
MIKRLCYLQSIVVQLGSNTNGRFKTSLGPVQINDSQ